MDRGRRKAALLLASLLSCLIGTAVSQEGLGDRFQPSVKASCVGGTMTIRVDTQEPFEGIIHGPNRTEAGCSVVGRGGTKTYLRIDLTKTDGGEGGCGVKYNERAEERKVAIAVRAHPTIELLEDRLYVVSCGRAGFQNSRNEVSVVMLKVSLPSDQERKVTTVLEGQKYNLRAEVLDHDPEFGILVRRCFAFDDSETSLQLVDDRGCRAEKLISEFVYDNGAGTADAAIYSMFRLPHSNRTYFQCDVAICRGECEKPQCDGNGGDNVVRAGGGPLTPLNNDLESTSALKTIGDDPFARPEDDAVTTSTSVFVAQPGTEESAGAIYCTTTFGGVSDEWLLWLCIAFGVLFAIMLLINIFLCSAMTCSCTRSEIIEKEPSIYDDYSIYDSQYGYTNNGKEYSESDYGSEYGMDTGGGGGMTDEHGQQQMHHNGGRHRGGSPSEAGTYHSRYDGGGSTLNRPRH